MRSFLKLFEWGSSGVEKDKNKKGSLLTNHAVLIGCHRSGEIILKKMVKLFDGNVVVVDFNPEVVEKLNASGRNAIYGDALDPEVDEVLNFAKAKLIVSTIRELPENLALLDLIKNSESTAVVVITASDRDEALRLYEKGAHHVSLPTSLEGVNITHILPSDVDDLSELKKERDNKLAEQDLVALKQSIPAAFEIGMNQ
jgi:Trk K+ transport system NAD-binding subunit